MGYLRGSLGGTNTVKNGYLRGTKSNSNNARPPTLSNKVKKLEREVGRLKPTLEDFRWNNTFVTVIGKSIHNLTVTEDIKDDADFRKKLLGDEWYNKQITCCFGATSANITRARIIIYSPKRGGSAAFAPSTGYEFVQVPDNTAWTVFSDTLHVAYTTNQPLTARVQASLKNYKTQYNSDGNIVERNNIKIYLVYQATTTDGVRFHTKILVANK